MLKILWLTRPLATLSRSAFEIPSGYAVPGRPTSPTTHIPSCLPGLHALALLSASIATEQWAAAQCSPAQTFDKSIQNGPSLTFHHAHISPLRALLGDHLPSPPPWRLNPPPIRPPFCAHTRANVTLKSLLYRAASAPPTSAVALPHLSQHRCMASPSLQL